jgi:hypothetical protein
LRYNKITWILLVASVLPAWSFADIAAAFADIGFGARAAGMGGAYTALASDPYGVLLNPACLPDARGWQASTMYTKQFNLVPYALAAAARGLGRRFGAGAAFLSSGDDVWRENTIFASFGMKLADPDRVMGRLALGLTLKYRTAVFGNNESGGRNRIQGSASGFGFDAGLRWKVSSAWTAGLLVRDVWNRVSYDNRTRRVSYDEPVPAALVMGTAYMPRENLVFTFDVDKALTGDAHDRFAAGMEWLLFRTLFIRTGFSEAAGGDPNRKVNFGTGLQHFRRRFGVRFDFAYQMGVLANTPRVSTSVWF